MPAVPRKRILVRQTQPLEDVPIECLLDEILSLPLQAVEPQQALRQSGRRRQFPTKQHGSVKNAPPRAVKVSPARPLPWKSYQGTLGKICGPLPVRPVPL